MTITSPMVNRLDELLAQKKANEANAPSNTGPVAPVPAPNQPISEPPPLYLSQEPKLVLKKETPAHRLIMYLRAYGLTNSQIATELGISTAQVSYVTRQKFFRQNVAKVLHESAMANLDKQLQAVAPQALHVMVDALDSQNENLRQKSASELLKLYKGTTVNIRDARVPLSQINSNIKQLQADIDGIVKGPN